MYFLKNSTKFWSKKVAEGGGIVKVIVGFSTSKFILLLLGPDFPKSRICKNKSFEPCLQSAPKTLLMILAYETFSHKVFFKKIPQNSSVNTNFKLVKVFSTWFVVLKLKAYERSVVLKKTHWKILSTLLLLLIFILFYLECMEEL